MVGSIYRGLGKGDSGVDDWREGGWGWMYVRMKGRSEGLE